MDVFYVSVHAWLFNLLVQCFFCWFGICLLRGCLFSVLSSFVSFYPEAELIRHWVTLILQLRKSFWVTWLCSLITARSGASSRTHHIKVYPSPPPPHSKVASSWSVSLSPGTTGAAGSSPERGHCIVFLGKTLYSHCASVHPYRSINGNRWI